MAKRSLLARGPPFAAMSLYRSEGDTPGEALDPLRRLRLFAD